MLLKNVVYGAFRFSDGVSNIFKVQVNDRFHKIVILNAVEMTSVKLVQHQKVEPNQTCH